MQRTPSWRWSPLVVLGVFAGCSFQASCGGKKLHMDKAKEFVSATLEKSTGQKPTEVTCPAAVEAKQGATFECTASFGPEQATVVIRQDDTEGNVTIASITGILLSAKAEQVIGEELGRSTNTHVTVACGARVRAAIPGAAFMCAATNAAGASATVEVTVKDAEGNIKYRVVGDPSE